MSTTEAGMTDRKTSSVDMNPTTDSSDELDNQRKASLPSSVALDPNGNGSRRGQLVHSVSIIVEPVLDDMEPLEEEGKDHLESSFLPRKEIMTSDTTSSSSFESQQRLLRKERIHSSPTIVMDDPFFGKDKYNNSTNDLSRNKRGIICKCTAFCSFRYSFCNGFLVFYVSFLCRPREYPVNTP